MNIFQEIKTHPALDCPGTYFYLRRLNLTGIVGFNKQERDTWAR